LFSAKAFKSGKSIGFSAVPPLCEKLNLTKNKLASLNVCATKSQLPQSLKPLYPCENRTHGIALQLAL